MLVMNNHAVFTEDNSVEILTDGRDKFKRLMKDISNAKIIFTFNTIFIKVMNWEKIARCFSEKSTGRRKSQSVI